MKPETVNHLQQYAEILGSLSIDTLDRLNPVLADNVTFIDPFNHLQGRGAFLGVMTEMFEKLEGVRFDIFDQCLVGDTGYLYWRFSCHSKLIGEFATDGCSRVLFDYDLKVVLHHDFWDASALMQQFPVLGAVIRKIRQKASYTVT